MKSGNGLPLLFVDQSQHMFFRSQQRLKSVAAAELAARIAWQITASGDRVGGMVLDNLGHHIFRPFRTVRATGRLLQQVAISNQTLARPTPDTADAVAAHRRLGDALGALNQLRQRRHRMFVISDLAGPLELWQSSLHRLASIIKCMWCKSPIHWTASCRQPGFITSPTVIKTVSFPIPAILRFERVTPPTTKNAMPGSPSCADTLR